jgi:hypothetical protein
MRRMTNRLHSCSETPPASGAGTGAGRDGTRRRQLFTRLRAGFQATAGWAAVGTQKYKSLKSYK